VRRRFDTATVVVAVPFLAFVGLFLFVPTIGLAIKAFTPGGSFGFSAMQRALEGTYRTAFINSLALAITSSLIGGVVGLLLALSLRSLQRPKWLRSTTDSWSAVAAQLGGIPLAFAFIAAIGTQGIITKLLSLVGVDISNSGFSLSEFWGLVVVYLYFQIPLMFLVMMPAVGGLKATWGEAAAIMGASPGRYWRSVALPLLVPSFLGGLLLLFVNSFAAYATAYVLNPGAQLVPLQIRFLLQGNVITGEQDLAYAIVLWTITLLLASLLLIAILQRRTARWAST
jgi:putative spermidine/putrescine transport system permease protein